MVETVSAQPLPAGTGSSSTRPVLEPGTEVRARVEANLPGGVVRLSSGNSEIDLRVSQPLAVGSEVTVTVSGSRQQPTIQITTGSPTEQPAKPTQPPASGQTPASVVAGGPASLPQTAAGSTSTTTYARPAPLLAHLVQIDTPPPSGRVQFPQAQLPQTQLSQAQPPQVQSPLNQAGQSQAPQTPPGQSGPLASHPAASPSPNAQPGSAPQTPAVGAAGGTPPGNPQIPAGASGAPGAAQTGAGPASGTGQAASAAGGTRPAAPTTGGASAPGASQASVSGTAAPLPSAGGQQPVSGAPAGVAPPAQAANPEAPSSIPRPVLPSGQVTPPATVAGQTLAPANGSASGQAGTVLQASASGPVPSGATMQAPPLSTPGTGQPVSGPGGTVPGPAGQVTGTLQAPQSQVNAAAIPGAAEPAQVRQTSAGTVGSPPAASVSGTRVFASPPYGTPAEMAAPSRPEPTGGQGDTARLANGLRTALSEQQAGMGGLFSQIGTLMAAQSSGRVSLPDPVIKAMQQIFGFRVGAAGQTPNAKDLQQAVMQSGQFREARLALPGGAQPQPDLKSALLSFRSLLQSLGAEPQVARPASQPPIPARTGSPHAQAQQIAGGHWAGAAPQNLRALLRETDTALARLRMTQLVNSGLTADDRPQAASRPMDLVFELPLAIGQETAVMQFQIGRDGGGKDNEEDDGASWRLRFALDLTATGPLEAAVSLRGGGTYASLWIDRKETFDSLNAVRETMEAAFADAGLDLQELRLIRGLPPKSAARSGAMVDRQS
ncbi:hypothetical protein FMN50_04595 [Rhodobacterales bacterium]|nr:hypothetical protein FMN50_04595 [Rhodobacterales bacterium]